MVEYFTYIDTRQYVVPANSCVGTMWTTKVTFTLEEADGMTTVRVVESGLSALPDELHGPLLRENSSGWTSEMADLQRHLEAVAAP